MNDQDDVDISSCPVTVHQLGSVLALIEQQDISGIVLPWMHSVGAYMVV